MAEAQFNLAISYDNGAGVPEDDRQEVYWCTKAAGQNYGDAQYNLGIMFANGEGVV
jgi:TPR repeat protein